MDPDVLDQIVAFLPLTIFGWVYAAIVFVVARKRAINPWGWTIGSAVPAFGTLVSAVFMILTLLSILDRLNDLERRRTDAG
ncbi:MAG TPA: hypothetical protein VKS60_11090 [Stellaceae bacterium]|nr:hypothetical protein [Stellaceae bacterium]